MDIREQIQKEMDAINAEVCQRLYDLVDENGKHESHMFYGSKAHCDDHARRYYPKHEIYISRRY